MRCDKCGYENVPGVRFCPNCGAYQDERVYARSVSAEPAEENTYSKSTRPVLYILAAVLAVVTIAEGAYILMQRRSPMLELKPVPSAVVEVEPTPSPVINVAVGDTLTMGAIEQDGSNENGAEPITWRVLAKEGDSALIISELVLDKKRYNNTRTDVTWETSDIRRWLNNEFLGGSFSAEEWERIIEVTNKNEPNPEYNTYSGVDTRDRVFLLSIREVWAYFKSLEDMAAGGTAVAAANGMGVSVYTGYGQWWLRTSGAGNQAAACVYRAEGVDAEGYWVDKDILGIRPAMWIALN